MPSKKDFPEHIAIIMDGNGRWAKRRGLPRSAGHLAGAKNIASVVRAAKELGVKILTVYAFSTENWKRSAEEVEYLMRLIPHFTKRLEKAMMKENVRLRTIGRTEDLPEFARNPLLEVIERTSGKRWLHTECRAELRWTGGNRRRSGKASGGQEPPRRTADGGGVCEIPLCARPPGPRPYDPDLRGIAPEQLPSLGALIQRTICHGDPLARLQQGIPHAGH